MDLRVGPDEISRVRLLSYLRRHLAALERLSNHTLEVTMCYRTIQTLTNKSPHPYMIKSLPFHCLQEGR